MPGEPCRTAQNFFFQLCQSGAVGSPLELYPDLRVDYVDLITTPK